MKFPTLYVLTMKGEKKIGRWKFVYTMLKVNQRVKFEIERNCVLGKHLVVKSKQKVPYLRLLQVVCMKSFVSIAYSSKAKMKEMLPRKNTCSKEI
jgi:hypothetical protein